jgi:hypothetical protein
MAVMVAMTAGEYVGQSISLSQSKRSQSAANPDTASQRRKFEIATRQRGPQSPAFRLNPPLGFSFPGVIALGGTFHLARPSIFKPQPSNDGAARMADTPHRHSPGATSIQSRNPRTAKRRNSPGEQSSDEREVDHVEAPGHVERELPTNDSQERQTGEWPNEGEGNKTADREYRKGTEEFVKSGRVAAQAQNAAEALDGAEGKQLRDAEEKGRAGKPK